MPNQNPTVIFVCEHGAAKSIIAASYFNQLAQQKGLILRALARGTNPDLELSEQTIKGLSKDGLEPTEKSPQKLSPNDLGFAQRIVSFCELPVEYGESITVEQWDDVPPVSVDYEKARDAIVERIQKLLNDVRRSS